MDSIFYNFMERFFYGLFLYKPYYSNLNASIGFKRDAFRAGK